MKAVNLLPKSSGVAGLLDGTRGRLVIAGAVGVVALAGFWAYTATQSADSAHAQLSQAQATQASLQQETAALSVFAARQQAIAQQGATVAQLAGARVDWERVVRDVVTVLPSGVWLNGITASLPTTTTAASTPSAASPGTLPSPDTAAPQGLELTGEAFTQAEVADTLSRLATVRGLGEPRLASSQATPEGTQTVYAFTVNIPINAQALDVPALASDGTTQGATP